MSYTIRDLVDETARDAGWELSYTDPDTPFTSYEKRTAFALHRVDVAYEADGSIMWSEGLRNGEWNRRNHVMADFPRSSVQIETLRMFR